MKRVDPCTKYYLGLYSSAMSNISTTVPQGFQISARTVLELGSELISSDIIAFYELVKNAFDAGSKTGVDIRFDIPLRRNAYLRLRASASSPDTSLSVIRSDLESALDPTASASALDRIKAQIAALSDKDGFLELLDEAYRSCNTITIEDNGSGMSLDDLRQNYLVIGTPSRKKAIDDAIASCAPHTPYLGEKGIGRLSAMRLGERLLVETARRENPTLNLLEIDWRRFGEIGAMVEDIPLAPQPGGAKRAPDWSGTILTIGDLAEDWTHRRVEEMAALEFSRLTDPFIDPKGRPRIAIYWNGTRVTIPWMDRALIEMAHAKVIADYAVEAGEAVLRCTLEARDLGFAHPPEREVVKLTLPDLDGMLIGKDDELPSSALTQVGPFSFEAHWYNRRRLGGIESIGDQRMVRELQRRWSGIMLFRDAFRVFPYGDELDDWLGLDRRALGRPGYTLNKTQFVGRVRIGRLTNPKLVDQTNREGLRETPEQQVLVRTLQHVIQTLMWDFLREVERRHKAQPIDLGDVKEEVKRLDERASSAIRRIRKLVPKEETELVDDLQQAFLEFRELTERAQRRIEEVEADGRQMVQMAGVGLMVEVVAHELARSSETALEALEGLKGRDLPANVRARLDTLRAEMKSVSKRLRVLDPMSISGRQRTELFDLVALLRDLEEGHASQFSRHGVQFRIVGGDQPLRIRAVKGMVVQILENLISNSIYWMDIRRKRESRYEPVITITLDSEPVTLNFADNGPGVAAENAERIFRPFWSQKDRSRRRGLGLFIARECAKHLGGTLALSGPADPISGRLNQFALELPDSVRA
jgi:signal transduction histidine kinase